MELIPTPDERLAILAACFQLDRISWESYVPDRARLAWDSLSDDAKLVAYLFASRDNFLHFQASRSPSGST
jgi:hypothetical protein